MRRAHSPHSRSCDKRNSRGAVIVEFALMLPLLALIILIIVDLGWILRETQILENAAREGARYSAQPLNKQGNNPNAIAQTRKVVIDYCSQENITVSAGNISVNQGFLVTVQPGGYTVDCSEVTITYQRQFLLPGTGLLPVSQMALVGRAVIRNLY